MRPLLCLMSLFLLLQHQLLATVLLAELEDYDAEIYFGDEENFGFRERYHSIGPAQLRVDNVLKWGLVSPNWSSRNDKAEIKKSLLDDTESIYLLAQAVKYFG